MTSKAFEFASTYRDRALKSVAFGVSSTPRGRQLPAPIVAASAHHAYIVDETGCKFIDYSLGYGPLVLGHSPHCVIDALRKTLDQGMRTASVHKAEAELGELIAETLPCAEISSFVSTGSEAIHLALRTARAATGRLPIIKFRGNYHGWFDNVHIANSVQNDGPATVGQDNSAAQNITLLDWGDSNAFREAITSDYAAVILEPVAINGGCIFPPDGFLEVVREETRKLGVVLIFDEVITGYRLSLGGAQERMGVTPDLAVIGKAMGSGLPIGAIAGNADVMEPIASGRMLHRGTFNGNPLSVAASIACISYLKENAPQLYPEMDGKAEALELHCRRCAEQAGVLASITRTGSALQIFLGAATIKSLSDTAHIDARMTAKFAAELLKQGVQIIPRGLIYLSDAHTEEDIETTKIAFNKAFNAL